MNFQQDLKAIEAYNENVNGNVIQRQNQLQGTGSGLIIASTTSITEQSTLDTQSHVSKGDWHFMAVFGCLSLINLMCAIDATILSVALSVRHTRESEMPSFLLI